jgi:hypothetical protein
MKPQANEPLPKALAVPLARLLINGNFLGTVLGAPKGLRRVDDGALTALGRRRPRRPPSGVPSARAKEAVEAVTVPKEV